MGNAVCGIEGGADWLDVVICGLGDRAGNTSFEEVVLSLEGIYGVSTGIKLEKLYELAHYVQKASGAWAQHWKAVVGDRVWAEKLSCLRVDRVEEKRTELLRGRHGGLES